MRNLNEIYRPITATPFERDEAYMEYEPCDALKPYIRCFWGAERPYRTEITSVPGLVIPDTCMDVIFNVNFTENTITGRFCGINDAAFRSCGDAGPGALVSTFAIRFYAWTAVLFSEDSLRDVKNKSPDAEVHFRKLKQELEPVLFEVTGMRERVERAERFLLRHIRPERENRIVRDAVACLLTTRGTKEIGKLEREIHVSGRQLQRLFKENMGISPKRLSSLIRYQYLWDAILRERNFNILDGVVRFGFTDQAHLMHEFKRYHGMTPSEAKKWAKKDVAFLQEEIL